MPRTPRKKIESQLHFDTVIYGRWRAIAKRTEALDLHVLPRRSQRSQSHAYGDERNRSSGGSNRPAAVRPGDSLCAASHPADAGIDYKQAFGLRETEFLANT